MKVNFSMPHIESVGLGGGSIVRIDGENVTVGPDSVGHRLTSKAKVFGGDVLTATDIAAVTGENVGNPNLAADFTRSA